MSSGRLAWALERLTEQNPEVERGTVRRIARDVARVWDGPTEEVWWRQCVEAGASLGLSLKVVDCTAKNMVSLARDGASLILLLQSPPDNPEYVVILGEAGQRMTLLRSTEPDQRIACSVGRLRRWVRSIAPAKVSRCVVLDARESAVSRDGSSRKQQTPLTRLQEILRPEWSDIWIVIVFAFVVGLLMLATPIAVEALVNTVAFGRFMQPVVVLATVLFVFLAFSAAIRALQTYVVEIIQQRLFARVAADLSYRLPRIQIEKSESHYMPELVNRFFDVVTVQKSSAQLLLDGVGLVLTTAIGMAVLAFYHPWLFGFDLLLMASLAFLIIILGRGAVASAVKESKMKYSMASWLEDLARCPTTFRTDGGVDFAMERADHLIKHYLSARQKHFRVLMRQVVFALGMQAIASTVLLGLGGWLVISGELTLGQLVAAELIVAVIVGGFAKLGKHMESFYDLLASVDKLGVLFDLPREHQDGLLVLRDDSPAEVHVQSVGYVRPEQKPVFTDLSFHVPPGRSLALVGPSGSGKSTAFDLLYALRQPTFGHVTINGTDPADVRPDLLRRQVALVRGFEVFHGSVAENVHLHRPEVSFQEVRDALGHVGLWETVQSLKDGLETELNSGGAPLSENQCRLLMIALAIAGQPRLLLIDGVLDFLSDEELTPLLQFLAGPGVPWTLIVATGREDVAQRCDEVHRLPSRISQHSNPQPV